MASKFLDYDGLLYFWTKLKSKFVAQEAGKGLSTNDYTTEEKNKLAGIEAEANKYVHPSYTARTGKPTSNQTPSFGATFTISQITSDALGHVTGATDRTVKIPNTSASGNGSGLMTKEMYGKLSNIDDGAEVNVIDTVKVNGTALTVTSKAVDVPVPTATSDLDNDSNFVSDASYVHTDNNFTTTLKNKLDGIADGATVDDHKWNDVVLSKTTATGTVTDYVPAMTSTSSTSASLVPAKSSPTANNIVKFDNSARLSSTTPTAGDSSTLVATTAFVAGEIASAIGSITGISFEIVEALPATGETGVIYLVSHSHGTGDIYDEYIWLSTSSSFEKIGSTDIDLSGYMLKTDMVAITNSEIDTIVAS